MTPEQESSVFEDLGAIKAGIQSLNHALDAHTAQDMTQFTAMTDTIKDIDTKVDSIISDMRVDDAIKKQHEAFVKKIATNRSVLVSFACAAFATIFQTFGYAVWQHFFG